MDKANVFVLSKDGTFLEKELIDILIGAVEKKFEIANAPAMNHIMMKSAHEHKKRVANAHNMPDYLIGAIEESEYIPIVIAWDMDEDDFPAPKYMVGDYEINALLKGLKENPNVDAWETTVRVNKEIRSGEKK